MTALADEIKLIIAQEGPISLERFVSLALTHPRYGYYMTRDPLGAQGDFTTAPEISQMFGELVGLWAAEVWTMMGSPPEIFLVELGPGRGSLMADALRAARVVSEFRAAIDVHLIEASPVLQDLQRQRLADFKGIIHWHQSVEEIPDGPAIIIANEFFDALPARQYVKTRSGWHERLVGAGPDGELQFGLGPDPVPQITANAPEGTVLEVGFAAYELMFTLAKRLKEQGGALVALDYGHTKTGPTETFQALKDHAKADPLATPGEADLTFHVDFAHLARAASNAGAVVSGPVLQADFLSSLGIFERAAGLKRNADVRQAIAIDRALLRLVSTGQETGAGGTLVPGMGALFKAIGVCGSGAFPLPGFRPRNKG